MAEQVLDTHRVWSVIIPWKKLLTIDSAVKLILVLTLNDNIFWINHRRHRWKSVLKIMDLLRHRKIILKYQITLHCHFRQIRTIKFPILLLKLRKCNYVKVSLFGYDMGTKFRLRSHGFPKMISFQWFLIQSGWGECYNKILKNETIFFKLKWPLYIVPFSSYKAGEIDIV